jgi:hypothetical protein
MHVFLGGPAGVSPGQKYLPDELAREIVTKHDLRKGVMISKQAIQDHLESVGVSMGLTTDVAMILRNVYGVQPMFYEDNETLINELGGLLNESFAMPFREDPPRILSEDELFEQAIEETFFETQTEEEEMMVAYLATLSLEDVEAIAHIEECLSEDQIEMLEAAYEYGGDLLGEATADLLARPHMFAFTEEAILESLEAICESKYLAEDAALALGIKAKTGAKKPKKGTIGHTEYLKRKFPSAHAVMAQGQGDSKKKSRRAAASAEMSKRKAAGKDMRTDLLHKSISDKGMSSKGTYKAPPSSQDAKQDFSKAHAGAKGRKQDQRGLLMRSKMSREGGDSGRLPSHTPKKAGLLKRGAELINTFKKKVGDMRDASKERSKVKAMGREGKREPGLIAKMKQRRQDKLQTAKSDAMGREGKKEPGFFSKMAQKAKDVVGRVGSHAAASARARAPRLTHMALGDAGAGEKEAAKVRQSAIDAKPAKADKPQGFLAKRREASLARTRGKKRYDSKTGALNPGREHQADAPASVRARTSPTSAPAPQGKSGARGSAPDLRKARRMEQARAKAKASMGAA